MLSSISNYCPTVFAVKDEYQIMLPVHTPCTFWVRIGEHYFYDDSNGTLRSDTQMHVVSVPQQLLNENKGYYVGYHIVLERKPYFSVMGESSEVYFAFRPVPEENIRLYQIADAHGIQTTTIGAAEKFMELKNGLDVLLLNGDVQDHSGSVENFMILYEIASRLTKGEIPTIFSRGNHDLRGICAEKLAQYTPGEMGHSYYSFHLGPIWGVVLDCGEDKNDDHPEYADTIRCHIFREKETQYLQSLVENSTKEYLAPGIKYRMVFSHVPFTHVDSSPFDIEQDIYKKWVNILNENIRPNTMMCGHVHSLSLDLPGSPRDTLKANFPVIVGSKLIYKEKYFAGCGVVFQKKNILVYFNDDKKVLEEHIIPIS